MSDAVTMPDSFQDGGINSVSGVQEAAMASDTVECDTCFAQLIVSRHSFPHIHTSGHPHAFTCRDCLKRMVEESPDVQAEKNAPLVYRIVQRLRFWDEWWGDE